MVDILRFAQQENVLSWTFFTAEATEHALGLASRRSKAFRMEESGNPSSSHPTAESPNRTLFAQLLGCSFCVLTFALIGLQSVLQIIHWYVLPECPANYKRTSAPMSDCFKLLYRACANQSWISTFKLSSSEPRLCKPRLCKASPFNSGTNQTSLPGSAGPEMYLLLIS